MRSAERQGQARLALSERREVNAQETRPVSKPIAIGSDEAGFRLKGILIDVLGEEGEAVIDFGCHSEDPVDYPDVAFELAQAVARGEHDRGILICGTGIGMSIAANKVPGVRAAQAHDAYSAERQGQARLAPVAEARRERPGDASGEQTHRDRQRRIRLPAEGDPDRRAR